MAFTRQRSGQNLFFDLVSALSGNPVTGQATGISGRVASDDGSQHVLACAIAEVGGGQYVAGLFPADLSGNTLGYLFTASGCVPRSFTIETTGNTSGSLSGQVVTAASGVFGTASLNSGQSVLVYSGQLSGQQVGVLSGQLSGQGIVTAASGVFGTASLNSGQSVLVYSGSLSGQVVTAASGVFARIASGQLFPDKTGYGLHASGLDAIQPESGINFRQSQSVLLAAVGGRLSGAGTANLTFGNASGVVRISGQVDSSGNRVAISWSPPI